MTERARRWRRAALEAVCDVIEPWAHGTVLRASRYPSYYDYNVVRVEDHPELGADELEAVAEATLGDLFHRRLDFEVAAAAEPVRADLVAAGWQVTRLVWMRHAAPVPPGPDIAVEEVDYDTVHELRVAWHEEDFPDVEGREYLADAREISMTRDVQVIATRAGNELVGFAQLERSGAAAEVCAVYVRPGHRGNGRGTAMTRAAIEAAGDVEDLWIVADDADRPKHLYARLGFRPAWTATEFLRLPGPRRGQR